MNRRSNVTRERHGIGIALRAGAIAGTAAAIAAAALPAAAHHSFSAEFDATKEVRATGAVTEVEWQNPHAWIHLNVTELCERPGRGGPPGSRGNNDVPEAEWACRTPDAQEGTAWAFELGSPNGLMRQGWTRNSLQDGDVVTISGTRARDGSTNSNARNVTKADGTRLFAGSSENANP
jgi:hypothetical protein